MRIFFRSEAEGALDGQVTVVRDLHLIDQVLTVADLVGPGYVV